MQKLSKPILLTLAIGALLIPTAWVVNRTLIQANPLYWISNIVSQHSQDCPKSNLTYPDLSIEKINRENGLPSDYIPENLLKADRQIKTIGSICVEQNTLNALKNMFTDAKEDGVELAITSGYRSPTLQEKLFKYWLRIEGLKKAEDEVAQPYHSEHQLGTAVDMTESSISYKPVDPEFHKSKGGKWLEKNAYKYGFILSYPRGSKNKTGYNHEPWHWRFVGSDTAKSLKRTNTLISADRIDKGYPPLATTYQPLKINSSNFKVVYIDPQREEKTLIEKGANIPKPIASITKMMTAIVADELYENDQQILITDKSVGGKGSSGTFIPGETLKLQTLLYPMLIKSENDLAQALANKIGEGIFTLAMNRKANYLGMFDTTFSNSTGLDPEENLSINSSTANDLVRLAKDLIFNHLDILEITTILEYQLDQNRNFTNTNKLLSDQDFPHSIIGAKTGETPRAQKNLLTITQSEGKSGYVITVVLGSTDHFQDTKDLLTWIHQNYIW